MTAALVSPDKLRGTATARAAADAIASVLESRGVQADRCPLSDGGEGFLDVLGGGNRTSTVTDPQGRSISVPWRLDGDTAVLETALVSANALSARPGSAEAERASSIGCGQLMAAAIEAGAASILVGLGGSAFSDGGGGALAAIEYLLPVTAEILLATDVRTRYPDAARIYGPQKGADSAAIERLTVQLTRTADKLTRRFGRDPRTADGTGAAGGLAGALWAVGAELRSGLDIVASQVNLDQRLAQADLIVTAEGRLDATSLAGKVVGGLMDRADGRPVWILAGRVEPGLKVPGATVVDLSAEYGSDRAMTDTLACLAAGVVSIVERSEA